jgi:hypothetical protein
LFIEKMVVNRSFRTLFLLLALLFTWINESHAQHNVLTVRVDTMTVGSQDNDILVGVYYKLTGNKPADFYGFDARINYDTTKLRAVQVLFQGTASENQGYHIGSTSHSGEVRAIVLGQPGLDVDTTNPLLYMVRFSVISSSFDTAFLILSRFDVTPTMRIDTVVRRNGWVGIRNQVKPPVNVSLQLSTVEAFGKSDSTISIPVTVSDLTKANLRRARFSFSFDSAVLDFLGSTAGSISGSSIKTVDSSSGRRHWVTISNSDTIQPIIGSGTLFSLRFHAKARKDSGCSELTDTAFRALNLDAHVDTIKLTFNQICVVGSGGVKSVAPQLSSTNLTIWPNPFVTNVTIKADGEASQYIEIGDVLGKQVLARRFDREYRWDASNLPTGAYWVRMAPIKENIIQWQQQQERAITKIQ